MGLYDKLSEIEETQKKKQLEAKPEVKRPKERQGKLIEPYGRTGSTSVRTDVLWKSVPPKPADFSVS